MPAIDGDNRHMTSSLWVQCDLIWRRNWTLSFLLTYMSTRLFWKGGRWKLGLFLLHKKVQKNAWERRKEKKERGKENKATQPFCFCFVFVFIGNFEQKPFAPRLQRAHVQYFGSKCFQSYSRWCPKDPKYVNLWLSNVILALAFSTNKTVSTSASQYGW